MSGTLSGLAPLFTSLAVASEQAHQFNLPTAPAKPTDRRRLEGELVQAEAFDPGTLAAILRDAIEARRDDEIAAEILAQESDQRAELVAKMKGGA